MPVVDGDARSRVILDPSVLFTEQVRGWMEAPDLKDYLVISQALWRRLQDPGALAEELARFGAPVRNLDSIEVVRNAIEDNRIETFSYEQARERGELRPGTEQICQALLEIGEPLADVLADEW